MFYYSQVIESLACKRINMLIQRLTVIGVGLIGGSLARALKRAGACAEIVGCGRNRTNLQSAASLGIIDTHYDDPIRAVKGSDMVVVAVPLGAMAPLFANLREALSPQAIITDVGSAKASVVADARQYLGLRFPRFVPGHPIAGSEKTGAAASDADLFENRRVILTPLPETETEAHTKVSTMWAMTGAEVVEMSVDQHDNILALTSHLPHLLAYSLVNTLANRNIQTDIFRFAAGGFRDITRIASSDPRLWRDICVANRDAILKTIEYFNLELTQLSEAIVQNDHQGIENVFIRAKKVRDKFCG